ncbi:RNA polymerase subunit sigma-70 [Paenibacillus selenitireducens]|jgi:RNA polymerase sigma-70 factor (ECF subfamily)|uniref:RNA polymerase subunit sigma-70 n=1 Tax=Paenibacillus selenitireducens TaxID=1324314 RepID=A0A1T2XGT7_9BACL|nr:sigma-70 family RNA polymerase sigma factor [Paenibacillus selenitireducens]OPA79022.1 RNA polymerase subunit sigma-70 [Paenibacillus selenitireducens]
MEVSEHNLDSELLKQNPLALEFLMNAYANVVYGLIQRILGGLAQKEDIEECVSDVFVAAWNRIDEYDRSKAIFKTWLLILAKYKALDYRRKLIKQNITLSLEVDPAALHETEDVILSKEATQVTMGIIDSFPEPDRSLFYRRYFYYEKLDVLALQYGLTKKAIESRLYRCRTLLRQQLDYFEIGGHE